MDYSQRVKIEYDGSPRQRKLQHENLNIVSKYLFWSFRIIHGWYVHILWEPEYGLLYFQMISFKKWLDLRRGRLVKETSVDQLLEEEFHITKLWILIMK